MKIRTLFTQRRFLLVAIFMCAFLAMPVMHAMNLLRPHDSLIRPPYSPDKTWNISFFAEHGFDAKGYNGSNASVNPLQIWSCNQNSLKMLEGIKNNKNIADTLVCLDGAQDDGTRGHICLNGDMFLDSCALFGRYHFHSDWYLTAYLPWYRMQLKNLCVVDQTKDLTAADERVKECLTNNLVANVCELGGPALVPFKRDGLGDLTVLLEWVHNYRQAKPFLKNVRINWRFGLTAPTGLREDEDKIFALPFGYDGSMAVIFGGGLDLTFGKFFKAGFDAELTHQFGNTRDRRIKTASGQTELLLLEKLPTYKDFGLTQKFNLYGQFYNVLGGLSGLFGYQFLKHGDDFIRICSQDYSNKIADSSRNLQEWIVHRAIFNMQYDFSVHMDKDAAVKPYLSLYAQQPFNGERALAFPTLGVVFALNF